MTTEQLLDYAALWRQLAGRWSAMAKSRSPSLALKLRQTAQTALFAAWEAEQRARLRAAIKESPATRDRDAD